MAPATKKDAKKSQKMELFSSRSSHSFRCNNNNNSSIIIPDTEEEDGTGKRRLIDEELFSMVDEEIEEAYLFVSKLEEGNTTPVARVVGKVALGAATVTEALLLPLATVVSTVGCVVHGTTDWKGQMNRTMDFLDDHIAAPIHGASKTFSHFVVQLHLSNDETCTIERDPYGVHFWIGTVPPTHHPICCHEWTSSTAFYKCVTVQDAIDFCQNDEANKPYDLLENNCKHTAYRVFKNLLDDESYTCQSYGMFRNRAQSFAMEQS